MNARQAAETRDLIARQRLSLPPAPTPAYPVADNVRRRYTNDRDRKAARRAVWARATQRRYERYLDVIADRHEAHAGARWSSHLAALERTRSAR